MMSSKGWYATGKRWSSSKDCNRNDKNKNGYGDGEVELPVMVNPMKQLSVARPAARSSGANSAAALQLCDGPRLAACTGEVMNHSSLPSSASFRFLSALPLLLVLIAFAVHVTVLFYTMQRNLSCDAPNPFEGSALSQILGSCVLCTAFTFAVFTSAVRLIFRVVSVHQKQSSDAHCVASSALSLTVCFCVFFITGTLNRDLSKFECSNKELPAYFSLDTTSAEFGTCRLETRQSIKKNMPACEEYFFHPSSSFSFLNHEYFSKPYQTSDLVLSASEIFSIVEAFRPILLNYAGGDSPDECDLAFTKYFCTGIIASPCTASCGVRPRCTELCRDMNDRCPGLDSLITTAKRNPGIISTIIPNENIASFISAFLFSFDVDNCTIPTVSKDNCLNFDADILDSFVNGQGNCTASGVEVNKTKNDAIQAEWDSKNDHKKRLAQAERNKWLRRVLLALSLSYLSLLYLPLLAVRRACSGVRKMQTRATEKATWQLYTSTLLQAAISVYCVYFFVKLPANITGKFYATSFVVLLASQYPVTVFFRGTLLLLRIPFYTGDGKRKSFASKFSSFALVRRLQRWKQRYSVIFGISGRHYLVKCMALEIIEITIQSNSLKYALSLFDNDRYCLAYALCLSFNCIMASAMMYKKKKQWVIMNDAVFDACYVVFSSLKILTMKSYGGERLDFGLLDALSFSWPLFSISYHMRRLATLNEEDAGGEKHVESAINAKSAPRLTGMALSMRNMFFNKLPIVFSVALILWGITLFAVVPRAVIMQRSVCQNIFGKCVWDQVTPHVYYKNGDSLLSGDLSCRVSEFKSLDLKPCALTTIDSWLLSFEKLENLEIDASCMSVYPKFSSVIASKNGNFTLKIMNGSSIREADLSGLNLTTLADSTIQNLATLSESKLEKLDFSQNMLSDLSGAFEILSKAKASNFHSIDFSGNLLQHFPPSLEFEKYTGLTHLNISFNRIAGLGLNVLNSFNAILKRSEGMVDASFLPVELLNWKDMEGTIPKFLETYSSLKYVRLSSAIPILLKGEIPNLSLSAATLETLFVSRMEATRFPSFISQLKVLKELAFDHFPYMSDGGQYFGGLSALTELQYISFSHMPRFSADLPSLCSLTDLQIVEMRYDISIGNQMQNCLLPNLIVASVTGKYNNDTGVAATIPTQIGLAQKLRYLEIRANFTGTIPSQISKLTHLQVLRVIGTNIRGPLPAQLGELTCLRKLTFEQHLAFPREVNKLERLRKNVQCGMWGTVPNSAYESEAFNSARKDCSESTNGAMLCDTKLRCFSGKDFRIKSPCAV